MKAYESRLWINIYLAIVLLALVAVGCGAPGTNQPGDQVKPPEETLGTPTEPPELPPISSFMMDFKDFVQTGIPLTSPPEIPPESSFIIDFGDFGISNSISYKSVKLVPSMKVVSFVLPSDDPGYAYHHILGNRKNWGFAALNVGFWSVLVVVGLAIPVAAFVESFDHKPEQQHDYTWIWSYTVDVKDAEYSAELHGKYIDEGVRWDMYISKKDEYEDFHWYYGESALPATEGWWILRKDPSDPTDFVRIDWHRDLQEETRDIKYTNIVPDGPENGGYIFHGVSTDESYDRFYEIYNKGKDNYTYIEWNSKSKNGRVKDERHFGDEEWHCWDSDYNDFECP